jgi:hypothetical protein
MVPLANPEEVHNFPVEVIKDLNVRRLFVKEHLRPSCKGLDVCGVFWK